MQQQVRMCKPVLVQDWQQWMPTSEPVTTTAVTESTFDVFFLLSHNFALLGSGMIAAAGYRALARSYSQR